MKRPPLPWQCEKCGKIPATQLEANKHLCDNCTTRAMPAFSRPSWLVINGQLGINTASSW